MTVQKRSATEDEYFMKIDGQKLDKIRGDLNKKRMEESKQKRKEAHWMKCPKCGSDLEELDLQSVLIDKCTDCQGIWLDKGELELLTEGKARFTKALIVKIFG